MAGSLRLFRPLLVTSGWDIKPYCRAFLMGQPVISDTQTLFFFQILVNKT